MLKVIELFGGIGACTAALNRLGIEHEVVDYVEIDKYACASYNAINGTHFEPQDICTWDKDIECDLIMHGSPCQDFSVAGQQAGGDEGSGTRSSLMYETLRIVAKLKPKYVIWENVKNLLSKKHRHNFDKYLDRMAELGYQNFYQVLNAKDYGIPQNRERVFTISILGGGEFIFPEKQELKLRLKDMLEEQVDEKYYLSDKMIKYISKPGTENYSNHESKINLDVARPITIDPNKRAGTSNYLSDDLPGNYDLIQIGQMYGTEKEPNPQAGRIYDSEGVSPAMDSCSGGNRQPKIIVDNPLGKYSEYSSKKIKDNIVKGDVVGTITASAMQSFNHDNCHLIEEPKALIKNATKQGYDIATDGDSINLQNPNSETRRARVGHQISNTLQTNDSMAVAVAQRGREQGQQLEISDREYANAITSVQKDSMVAEPRKNRRDIKTAEKYCEYCGNKLERKRFNGVLEDFTVFKNRKYCNRECMKRAYLKIGENKQTYSNAHTTARKINELILHKECCELCGSTRNLDIHHIDGNWQNNNLDNLMCLCRSCHAKYEFNKNKIGDDEPMNDRLRIRKLTPKECWRL